MCLLMDMAKRKPDKSSSGSSGEDSDSTADEDEQTENAQQNGSPTPNKVQRTSKTDLSKDPSPNQLVELKETENLFQSSLLRLQITELLTEVCLKDGRKKKIEEKIQDLKVSLLALPDGKMYTLSDTRWLEKKGLQVPVIQEPKSRKGNFHFLAPRSVEVVGSFLLGTCIKPGVHVDLAVTMPKECIQAKDHLNHRYIRKRALYLTTIAHHLQSEDLVHDLKFTHHHGDNLKPVLQMRVKDGNAHGFEVHIHIVPESGSFKLNRFHITKNNVRKYWVEDRDVTEDSHDEENLATPLYNTAILRDLTLLDNTRSLEESLSATPGIKHGMVLLKVWLRQRELSTGYGSFSGFIVSMFVLYLLSQRRLNKFMSSYQVFRNTLLSLSSSDWCEKPISLCTDTSDEIRPSMSDFQGAFDVVFVDHSGYTNLCAGITRSLYNRVVHEARLALQFLEDRRIDSFDVLFLKPVSFLTTFDHLFHLTNLEELHHCIDKLDIAHKLIDYHGNYILACIPAILDLLSRSLGRRARLVQMRQMAVKQWPVNKKPPKMSDEDKLTFGLLLDPEFVTSVVEKGPLSDSVEAKEFIDFWGNKSELRRFQDGVICEAVVWTTSSLLNKKRLVSAKIVKYVLQRHAALSEVSVHYVGSQLDGLLRRPRLMAEAGGFPYGTGEEQHILIQHAYTGLTKQLRGLNLPLAINSIQGISPVFRFAEVFPAVPALTMTGQHQHGPALPNPSKLAPRWVPCMEVVCMLETSGKWPEDMEGVRRLKAAFLIQIGNALSSQCLLPVQIKPACVHVLKDGYVFQVKLSYSREIAVSKMIKMADGTVKFKDTEESVSLEKDTKILPVLTSTLHGLYQQHNSFSCVVRLAKRWTAAQMLTNHIPDVAVELIVAHLYLHPAPFLPPGSPVVGFLRFLQLVSTFDWKLSPFIVNLNNKFSVDDVAEIVHQFNKQRTTLPLMFLSTPDDRLSSYWTRKSPTAPVLRQFVVLAQKAADVLENQIKDCSQQHDFKTIFRPSFEIFDVLIHLDLRQLPRQHEAVDITKATRIPPVLAGKYREVVKTVPVLDYDPVQYYLDELEAAFDDLAMFCYDKYGGTVIGVIWKPAALQPKEFKVSAMVGRMLSVKDVQSDETVLTTNFGAVLNDFAVMGRGLVNRVETLRVH
ncbi:nucleolar protein 6-like [Gigantopelta aegis]|uniref:nucleolar protein 6-like n=1 Tax=Gigantopelta aegis TaxID=1735272 RepID=UPI001B888F9B|nr:nucleolar protein 6-like [Gigantopelta aegis]